MDCASDYALAAFSGTLLALLVVWILTGRTDELRRGVRSLFDAPPSSSSHVKESYTPVKLSDYSGEEDEEEE